MKADSENIFARRNDLKCHIVENKEYKKMINGQVYNPLDMTLIRARKQARVLCAELNSIVVSDTEASRIPPKNAEIIQSLFGKVDNDSLPFIEPNFRCDYGLNISFGKNVELNFDCTFLDCGKITIGNRVLFGPNVHIYTVTHSTDENHDEFTAPVTIEDNVWIGGNATILCGVTIGKGATIGAGSVVRTSVPPGATAVGVPARIIKQN